MCYRSREIENIILVMPNKPKQLKKRTKWTDMDELFLLELWEEKFQMLRGSRKNNHIYKEMANSFLSRDVVFSPEEICVKIHNLTSRYRKEKNIVGPSGGSPSDWKLFHRVHAILGQLRIHNLDSIVEDSIENEVSMSGRPSPPPSPSPSPSPSTSSPLPPLLPSPNISPTASDISDIWEIVYDPDADPEPVVASTSSAAKKRKRNNIYRQPKNDEVRASEKRIMQQMQEIKNSDEEIIKIEKERNAILDRFVSSSEQFQNDIIAYLYNK